MTIISESCMHEPWFMHVLSSEALLFCQGYATQIHVMINRPDVASDDYLVRLCGIDRGGVRHTVMTIWNGDYTGPDMMRTLSSKLVAKVRRFEEDREINLTP